MPYEWNRVYLTRENPNSSTGATADFVGGGNMGAPEFERVWQGDHYRPIITTPLYDGRNVINTGAGDDYVVSSSGNDAINGGAGFDLISFAADTTFQRSNWEYDGAFPRYQVTVNLSSGSASFTTPVFTEVRTEGRFENGGIVEYLEFRFDMGRFGSFNHTISGFEAVRATNWDDTITGSNADLELFDLSDNGQDTLDGAGGEDWVAYGQYSGILFDDLTAIRVDLEAGTARTREVRYPDVLTFTSQIRNIEHVLGSLSDDRIFGDDGRNSIFGNIGDDTLDGRGGRDVLVMELQLSESVEHALTTSFDDWYPNRTDPNAGVTVDLAQGTTDDGQGNRDTVSNFEDVIGTSRNDTITGDGGRNTLFGLDGADILIGGNGADRLEGGDGTDTLTGGNGKDVFAIGTRDGDVLEDFAFGQDSLVFI